MFLYFFAGIVLAAVVAWLLYRSLYRNMAAGFRNQLAEQSLLVQQLNDRNRQLQSEKENLVPLAAQATFFENALRLKEQSFDQVQKDYQEVQTRLSALNENHKNVLEKLALQKQELNTMGEAFKFEFRNLAQNILEEKTQKFTEVNEQKMKAILDPLKTDLGLFKQKVEETYNKESKERFSLGKEIERLVLMTQQVSDEANNLTSALKGNTKIQGNWGEMILESLLENSGLIKGREYFLQEFIRDNAGNIIKDEHGSGLQPDVMICYPDQRKIIIDSKVSLIAWDECNACDNKEEQLLFLQKHIRSIRLHIENLYKKNYSKYAKALDYVLLFIPIEPAFLEAVKSDQQLWKFAWDRKILLVSPTNLFAVLKIIADLWKVEQQNKNAIEIADKAGALYDKFVLFLDNFEMVGKRIAEAGNSYESALRQLSTGRGNMIGRMEELKKMGASAGKQIPDKVLANIAE